MPQIKKRKRKSYTPFELSELTTKEKRILAQKDKKKIKEDTAKGAVAGGLMGAPYGAPGIIIGGLAGGAIGRSKSKKNIRDEKEISKEIFQGDNSLSSEEYAKREKAYKIKKKKNKWRSPRRQRQFKLGEQK